MFPDEDEEGKPGYLYEIFGVKPSASEKELQKAYRELARKFHPDKLGSEATANETEAANTNFNRMQKIFEILKDPEKRRAYDAKSAAFVLRKQRQDQLDAESRHMQTRLKQQEAAATARRQEKIRKERELEARKTEERKKIQREMEEEAVRKKQHELLMRKKFASSDDNDAESEKDHLIVASWNSKLGQYTRDQLVQLCRRFGEIRDVIPSQGNAGRAYIHFRSLKAAIQLMAVVQDEGKMLGGAFNPIHLHWADPTNAPSSSTLMGSDGIPIDLTVPPADDHDEYQRLVFEKISKAADLQRLLDVS